MVFIYRQNSARYIDYHRNSHRNSHRNHCVAKQMIRMLQQNQVNIDPYLQSCRQLINRMEFTIPAEILNEYFG